MPLEDLEGPAKYLDALNRDWPLGTLPDTQAEGDDHLRGIKNVLQNSFPNIAGPVAASETDLDAAVANISTIRGMVPFLRPSLEGLTEFTFPVEPDADYLLVGHFFAAATSTAAIEYSATGEAGPWVGGDQHRYWYMNASDGNYPVTSEIANYYGDLCSTFGAALGGVFRQELFSPGNPDRHTQAVGQYGVNSGTNSAHVQYSMFQQTKMGAVAVRVATEVAWASGSWCDVYRRDWSIPEGWQPVT